ncbi:MAG: hypothetical protein ABI581_10335, partial [Sediminibacterium sp.]
VTADDTEYPAGRLKINSDSIAYGGAVTLTAAINNTSSFHWDFGDGTSAVTTDSIVQQHYYQAKDSVHVQLEAISPRNCITHFDAWLKVLPQTALPKRETVVNGNLKDWNVFPIPFHDHLKVSVILQKKQAVKIDLFTAEGRLVKTWELNGVQGENLFTLAGLDQLQNKVLYYITSIYNNQKHFDKVYKY